MIRVNLRAGPIDLWHAVVILSQKIKKALFMHSYSLVLSTRLAVHKQSFLNLLRKNGRRVTKVCLQEDVKWEAHVCLTSEHNTLWLVSLSGPDITSDSYPVAIYAFLGWEKIGG